MYGERTIKDQVAGGFCGTAKAAGMGARERRPADEGSIQLPHAASCTILSVLAAHESPR